MNHQLISPLPEDCLPQLWGWLAEFRKQMVDAASPETFTDLLAKYRSDHAAGAVSFGAFRETGNGHRGELLGIVWGEFMGDGIFTGHMVFSREISSAEKMEIAKSSLAQWTARKIRWPMFSDNRAYRIFLRRLGAKEEGLFHEEARREGELQDVIVMASFPKGRA